MYTVINMVVQKHKQSCHLIIVHKLQKINFDDYRLQNGSGYPTHISRHSSLVVSVVAKVCLAHSQLVRPVNLMWGKQHACKLDTL